MDFSLSMEEDLQHIKDDASRSTEILKGQGYLVKESKGYDLTCCSIFKAQFVVLSILQNIWFQEYLMM